MKKITEWIDDLKMKSSENFLPETQNDLIRELNGFPDFRKMTKGMRAEIIRRALELSQGLPGVLKALDMIFDLGNTFSNPKGKPELFGNISDYGLLCDLYNRINSELR